MRVRVLLPALLLALAPLSAAHACVCSWGSTQNALERADIVFLGRPIAFRPSLLDPLSAEVTRFAVERVWKGDVPTEVNVVAWYDNSCGAGFYGDGALAVVFAHRDAWGRMTTWACSGTMILTNPEDRRVALPNWYDLTADDLAALPDSVFATVDSFPEAIAHERRVLAELGPGRPPARDAWPDLWLPALEWGTIAIAVLLGWTLVQRRRSRPLESGAR